MEERLFRTKDESNQSQSKTTNVGSSGFTIHGTKKKERLV